jgi:hypothetical protein
VKFRRKSADAHLEDTEAGAAPGGQVPADEPATGPFSFESLAQDGVPRVDLGSLLIPVTPEREIRLQMTEATQEVIAVQIVGPDGALEVRAFAAPRNGDLWARAREDILAEAAARGAELESREGRFGVELISEVVVETAKGPGRVPARLIGVNGDRWLLRGSFIGGPATDPDLAGAWDDTFASVVVRRGSHALPVGDPLPLALPTQQVQPVRQPETEPGAG